jgi:hypothetical protein
MEDIRQRAKRAGRDPESISVTVFGLQPEALDEYRRLGVDRAIFRLPYAGAAEVLPELDRYAKLLKVAA